jgi:membrane-associated phospholipid phosphatase
MWHCEWITIGYFLYLAGAACLRPVARRRRVVLLALAIAAIVVIPALARFGYPLVRAWAPAAYILIGYYASAYVFIAPSTALESWLMAWDRRLLGDPATRFAAWPRPLLAFLEIIYLGCFLLVGAGFLVFAASGRADLADWYWTLVVAAEFGSFAPLAFIQTRPPWAIERKPVLADRRVHELAVGMTDRFTIRVNTFPSGHVAGSLAAAIAVGAVMPRTGALFLVLAVCIAVATVAGRYHYIVDGIAGAALTLLLWALVVSFGFAHV